MPKKPKKRMLHIERQVSASMFNSVGLLIIIASTLEFILANALLRLIGTAHAGAYHAYPLVTGMDFKVKISLIRVYTKMYRLPRATQINQTLDKIDRLFGTRNAIAHSLMLPTGNKRRAKFQDLRAKIKSGTTPQPRLYTDEAIRDAAIEMHGLVNVLNRHLTDSNILTNQQYGQIDELNHQLALQMAQALEEAKENPTTQKMPSEPRA